MDDSKLIDLVHSYDHLYDRKRSDFKDIKKKENSWKEIALLTNYSVSDVQNRWKYLREKYSRERNSSNLPSGSAAPDKRPWHLLKSLQWLEPYMQKRRSKSNLEGNVDESLIEKRKTQEKENVFEEPDEINMNQLDTRKSQDIIFIEDVDFSSSVGSSSGTQSIASTPSKKVLKNSRKSTESEVLSTFHNMSQEMKSTINLLKNKNKTEEDEDDLFGKLIATELKKKSIRKKKELKRKIFLEILNGSDSE
ncbi:hypothetical protein ABEB36_010351 [Hypothenemus hampei]|uniref:MADF domain-containing protein n=1 Tax=Hypothenemus hampei TaxID=57062 RepID=A0ABD1EJD8_HYPHA